MINQPLRYAGLSVGLSEMALPQYLILKRKRRDIPVTLEDFSDNLVYGQKMYLQRPEPEQYGIIIRFIAGYYYPIVTGRKWDDKQALKFGAWVLRARVLELFPVALHLVNLMGELATREIKLLERKPTQQEKQAGIDKLNKFSDLSAIVYLQESFKCTMDEVMLKPYNDCLVRFMYQKEQNSYAERLAEVYRREQQKK